MYWHIVKTVYPNGNKGTIYLSSVKKKKVIFSNFFFNFSIFLLRFKKNGGDPTKFNDMELLVVVQKNGKISLPNVRIGFLLL